jgi:leucyl aminopeptidase
MAKLGVSPSPVSTFGADALILGVMGDGEVTAHAALPEKIRASITEAARPLEPSRKVGAITLLASDSVAARRVVLVGLGDGNEGDLRDAAGSASRECGKRPGKVVVALPALTDSTIEAVAEGLLLGAYRFSHYKTPKDGDEQVETEWFVAGATSPVLDRASIIATAVNATRDLVNTAPLDLYPETFAVAAESAVADIGVAIRVWDVPDLMRDGFGGILGVGLGSPRSPRMIRIEWKGKDASETVALVGKGITFDTGGISIKSNEGMLTMKSDMSGAAAVLHIVVASAKLHLPINVTGWLCLAENMPSGTAQRPSDIIRIHGGKSVEVMNTDAEGRLVLADGLDAACAENPDVVLDIATLTGAQGLALGSRTSAVMGTPAVRDAVVAAANQVDEPLWPMPLPEHLREGLDSTTADLRNVASDTKGGMLTAGLFLREFVGETPWAHLDIARPAFNEGSAFGSTPPGGTGASVRTVLQFLEARSRG